MDLTPRSAITRINYQELIDFRRKFPEYSDFHQIIAQVLASIAQHASPLDEVYGMTPFDRLRAWLTTPTFIGKGHFGIILRTSFELSGIPVLLKTGKRIEKEYEIGSLLNQIVSEGCCYNFAYTYLMCSGPPVLVIEDSDRIR